MTTLFIHIPKNAGSSIVNLINKDENYIIMHHYPTLLNDQIDISLLNIKNFNHTCKKTFTVIRNPYDRFLSAYNYLLKGGCCNILDLEYQKILLSMTFEEFIYNLDIYIYKIVHFIPQYLFICDENNEILVTDVCKFENLKNSLMNIDSKFKMLEHHNKSEKCYDFNENFKNKIYEIYEKDFLIFNYTK